MLTAQIVQSGYTFAELRWELSRVRKRRVPDRTLWHWLKSLSIKADGLGLYNKSDLEDLTQLVYWLKRGRTIAQFQELMRKKYAS